MQKMNTTDKYSNLAKLATKRGSINQVGSATLRILLDEATTPVTAVTADIRNVPMFKSSAEEQLILVMAAFKALQKQRVVWRDLTLTVYALSEHLRRSGSGHTLNIMFDLGDFYEKNNDISCIQDAICTYQEMFTVQRLWPILSPEAQRRGFSPQFGLSSEIALTDMAVKIFKNFNFNDCYHGLKKAIDNFSYVSSYGTGDSFDRAETVARIVDSFDRLPETVTMTEWANWLSSRKVMLKSDNPFPIIKAIFRMVEVGWPGIPEGLLQKSFLHESIDYLASHVENLLYRVSVLEESL